jgi:sporadic carbohydrate cluster protein (TIGR04323 family)
MNLNKKIILKGYVFSRPFLEERVPQHIQNLALRDYCKKNNFDFILSATEYCMNNTYLNLNNLLKNFSEYDGILAYSLFQLPNDISQRTEILKKIILKGKTIHFCVETMCVEKIKDIEKINDIWLIKQTIIELK